MISGEKFNGCFAYVRKMLFFFRILILIGPMTKALCLYYSEYAVYQIFTSKMIKWLQKY